MHAYRIEPPKKKKHAWVHDQATITRKMVAQNTQILSQPTYFHNLQNIIKKSYVAMLVMFIHMFWLQAACYII